MSPLPPSTDATQVAGPAQNRRSADVSVLPPSPTAPVSINHRYQLGDEIARGGMGAVHYARDRVLKRDIAIKVLLSRTVDPSLRERFEYEAAVTAQLQHPNIPPVHDLGTLPDGRPFLAMKLIKGETLADQLRKRSCVTADLGRFVASFEAVCQAIGYAHSRGILHRDLKPNNVMVGAFGEVQVMDWGLAKIQDIEDRPLPSTSDGTWIKPPSPSADRTTPGSVMGTPAYMPPEQALGNVGQISERSDVFGLGGILCAILTGSPPFVGGNAESTHQLAAEGRVQDAFEWLDASGADPALVALCKRCLSVKPTDRPADGNAVAEAVAALRRDADDRANRAALEATAAQVRATEQRTRDRLRWRLTSAVAGVLAVGVFASAWQTHRAVSAERQTAEQLVRAEAEERRATASESRAVIAGEETKNALRTILDVFADIDHTTVKKTGRPLEVVLANRLIAAGDNLTPATVSDPRTLVELLGRLGMTLINLGEAQAAERILARADDLAANHFGEDDPTTLLCSAKRAEAEHLVGQVEPAIRRYERVIALGTARLGADHVDVLRFSNNLAIVYKYHDESDKALAIYERTLPRLNVILGPDHPDTIACQSNLCVMYQEKGRATDALPLLEATLARTRRELGPDHPTTLSLLNNLSCTYELLGRPAEALPHQQEAVRRMTAKFGADHPSTFRATNNLAALLDLLGRPEEATRVRIDTFQRIVAKLGPDHPDSLVLTDNLAAGYWKLGRLDESIPLFEQQLARRTRLHGRNNKDTLHCMANLAVNYRDVGRWADARPLFEEVYRSVQQHPILAVFVDEFIRGCFRLGDTDRGRELIAEKVRQERKKHKPNSLELAAVLVGYGVVLVDSGCPTEAELLLREGLQIRQQVAPDAWTAFSGRAVLGGALLGQKKYAEAETLLKSGYDGLLARRSQMPAAAVSNIATAGRRLVALYQLTGRPELAARLAGELPTEPAPPPRRAGRPR